MEFEYYGTEIDISFVRIPEEIKDNENWMDKALNNIKNNSLGRVYPLSSYKSNLLIMDLLLREEKRLRNFRLTLIALKIWAKSKK